MQNSRYKDLGSEKSEVSILNLKIESGEVDKDKLNPEAKVNLGYVGLSELRNLQADADRQLKKDVRRDDGTFESNTEIISHH